MLVLGSMLVFIGLFYGMMELLHCIIQEKYGITLTEEQINVILEK